jgi:hypothetical protein
VCALASLLFPRFGSTACRRIIHLPYPSLLVFLLSRWCVCMHACACMCVCVHVCAFVVCVCLFYDARSGLVPQNAAGVFSYIRERIVNSIPGTLTFDLTGAGLSMVRCSAVQCGAVRCGAVRCGAVRCGAVRCGAVRCGAVRCGAVRCGAGLHVVAPTAGVFYSPCVLRQPSTCKGLWLLCLACRP